MFWKALSIIAPLSLLATAVALTQQDEPAEKVFKNIKSFTGKPARDVLPSMRFISSALNVKCSYCHNPRDFSSDEKEEKRTAREMIAMMNGLNKQYFEGRPAINCNSCHNGHTRPNRTPLLPGLSERHERFQTDLKAEDVLKKYEDAVGGDLRSLDLKGTQSEGKDSTAYELLQASPNKFLATFDKVLVGYDGSATWHSVDGHTRVLWGDNAVEVQRTGRWFRGATAFSRYEDLNLVGRDKVAGKPCLVVRGFIRSDGVMEELYFDEKTGLLSRVATFTQTPLGMVPSFTDFANYRKVKGVKVPFKISTTSGQGETSVLQFKSGTADVKVDDRVFSPPAAK